MERQDQPVQIPIDLKNATPQVCECGCKYFKQVFLVYKVSAFSNPTGKELIAQQPVFLCMECGKMLGEKDAERNGGHVNGDKRS